MYSLFIEFITRLKSSLFLFLIITSLCFIVSPVYANTIAVNISSGNDDAEDKGGISNDTNDEVLNIGESDNDGAGYIGLRFQNVSIPKNSIITNAYITFTSNANQGTNPSDTVIYAEDSSSPSAYNGTTLIRNRTKTSTSVSWSNIPDWSINGIYNTSNISSLVQSIINRNDWVSGNNIAFIIQNNTVNARRPARSYESPSNKTLRLTIEFTPLSLSINDITMQEGNSGYTTMNFTVTLSNDANATVNYTTVNGIATAGADFNATSGTLTFVKGGAKDQTISVPIIGDISVEPNELFYITLSNAVGAIISDANGTGTILNDDILLSYCDDQNLSDGFHIANPFNDINKSIEIYCYNNKDYIALPIKNNSNNFVFNNNALASINYYNEARDHANHFDAIEINAYTLKVETNTSVRLPQTINAPTTFKTMGASFSNINFTGTPFAIDWANTTISNCTQAKLRTAYYGQDVKINSLDYDAHAICNIDTMKLKLLDNYRYLEYESHEVLQKSCKTMAEAVPTSFLDSASIQGHYWISPFSNARSYGATNIKSDNRPIVAYCWYQTDLDWVWTFSLAMDGKVTNTKTDLINKNDTCSEFGLVPFVANKEDTFERVRQFLYNNKTQWVNYTGTINEKFRVFNNNSDYYLASEHNSTIWPYGSFGVYHPGRTSTWGGSNTADPGPMSGSPMHNISNIITDYTRLNDDEGNTNRDYYSWGINRAQLDITSVQTGYSDTDTLLDDGSYPFEATMGYKGWVSILGAADLNKTNEWFISRTGAGANFDHSSASHPYYEPNGNYTGGAWLNYLFDSNGRVRHNDDLDSAYSYYDYMCMAEDNYDFTTRYGLIAGPFKAIEHSVAAGSEIANTSLTTKIVNDTLHFDIALLTDNLSAVQADKNTSVGIFLDDTYMVGSTETPRDVHYFGDIKRNGAGTFNALKATGRFELPASSWPAGVQTWSSANKRLFFKFKYCSRNDYEWTQCWTPSGVTATCTVGQEAYCKTADSNDFAIRPKNFDFSISGTSPYKAGVGYSTTFDAKDYNNNATSNYNEAIPLTYNEAKVGCITGNFNSSLVNMLFVNGTKNIPSLSYSEVGVLNIKMEETLGSEFALVDATDTSSAQRLITPYDQNWSYTPDHFVLTGSHFDNNATGFTYLSSDLNMSANLNLTIIAQNLNNATTQNYNSACYSKTTSYGLSYTPLVISPSSALSRMNYLETNTSTSGNLPINNTWNIASIPNTIFSTDNNGTGRLNIKVNFDRNSTKTVNPFIFTTRDMNVTDFDGILGGIDLNQSTTFYYGRAHAPDYRFPNKDGNATIYYEVYCKDCNQTTRTNMGITGNESVNALNWYQNALHVSTAGLATPVPAHASDFSNTGITHTNPITTQRLTLQNATSIPYVDRVNLNSSTWLIHYPTDFTVEFYSSGSWAGAGFVKEGQPNATDTNTTVGEYIHKTAPIKANRRITW